MAEWDMVAVLKGTGICSFKISKWDGPPVTIKALLKK